MIKFQQSNLTSHFESFWSIVFQDLYFGQFTNYNQFLDALHIFLSKWQKIDYDLIERLLNYSWIISLFVIFNPFRLFCENFEDA